MASLFKLYQLPIRVTLLLALMGCVIVLSPVVNITLAQPSVSPKSLEERLAKSYYYLASFAKWPEDRVKNGISFCVERKHFLYSAFSKFLPTRRLANKQIELHVIDFKNKSELNVCDIIALRGDGGANRRVVQYISNKPVLTVGSESDITNHGGIAYIPLDGEIRAPKINLDNLRNSSIHIDSALLDFSVRAWADN